MEHMSVAWLIGYLGGVFYNDDMVLDIDRAAFSALAKKVANLEYQ